MTYRDDRDALKARVEQLEQDLADAHREGEEEGRRRAEALAADLEKLRREMARVEGELGELRGEPNVRKDAPLRRAGASLVLALVLVLGAGTFFFFFFWRQSARVPPPAPLSPPALPANTAPLPIGTQPEPEPPPVPPPRPAPPQLRHASARWSATVRKAEGIRLARGAACTIDAEVEARGTNAKVPALSVTCGKEKLYDASDALNGMAQMGNDARERIGPHDDQSTFTIQYTDVGSRTGARSQIDLDSKRGDGAVWRDTGPRFRVELAVTNESAPSPALSGPSERLRGFGKVADVSGSAGVKKGDACLLRAMPTGQSEACVAEVACGKLVLFPQSAPVECTYSGARPVTVEGTGSPSLRLEGAKLSVANDKPAYEVAIDLEGE